MNLAAIFGTLALISLGLLLWQWLAARGFPFDQRAAATMFTPAVTLLKPLPGADDSTESCLRSWFKQDYAGAVQILFAVSRANDPVCDIVRQLIQQHPECDAQLVVCAENLGANPKVSKLVHLELLAKHAILVLSDADVFAPEDCLRNIVVPLQDPRVGIVNCFYRMLGPVTPAMRWEAVAVNADFWSQVLQARSLGPLKFALGATLAVRREAVREIGGFAALANCLADDYELGRRIAGQGYHIELCPVVTECRESQRGWRATWRHQLRWARTIRVCQPVPYFASILSNATLWPLVWLAANPTGFVLALVAALLGIRLLLAGDLMSRLTGCRAGPVDLAYVWAKDVLQAGVWLGAFLGNTVEWRGERYGVNAEGVLGPPGR